MKFNFILITALILLGFNGFSQALIISPSDTISFSAPLATGAGDTFQSNASLIFITNKSHNDTILWKIIANVQDSTWTMGFCDGSDCFYFSSADTNTPIRTFGLFDSNQTANLDLTSAPACVAGSGELKILIWLQNDSAASASIITFLPTFTGVCSVTGIHQTAVPNYKIYPTPLNSELNVEGLNTLGAIKITLYDLIGNAIIQNNYTDHPDLVSLNTSGLIPGIYFLSVESGGQRIITKRVEKLN